MYGLLHLHHDYESLEQDADAEDEAQGGRRRARDVRREARQAERDLQQGRMRKREVSAAKILCSCWTDKCSRGRLAPFQNTATL